MKSLLKLAIAVTVAVSVLIGCSESPIAPKIERVVDTLYLFNEGVDTVVINNVTKDTVYYYDSTIIISENGNSSGELVPLTIDYRIESIGSGWITDGQKVITLLPPNTIVKTQIQRGKTAHVLWEAKNGNIKGLDSTIVKDSTHWKILK